MVESLLAGFAISVLISLAAYWRRSLAKSGVLGAIAIGTMIFGLGGWVWGLLLIAFFVLSSALSHFKVSAKEAVAIKFDKGGRRDLGQVLANGGAGALLALAFALMPHPLLMAAFVGAMATVNADTWATELGVLSKRPPRLITNGQVVEPGTSGGVSLLGTAATLAGALAMGLAVMLFVLIDGLLDGSVNALLGTDGVGGGAWLVPSAVLGGLTGSLFDSLLGATVQAIYYSPSRHKETEKKIDPDGTPNEHRRGWQWLTNDWVNAFSSVAGALIGAACWGIVR
ncbi:MAG: DUF92 domain-containing protein [Anaerolineae bacterium]|nr:DUF92 domain-containing protein [Anaerolineae bacterium]